MRLRSRRELLAATAGLLAGCLDASAGRSEDCSRIEPARSDEDDDGVTDLVVRNDRSATATVEISLEGPEGARCSTVDLDPGANEAYPDVFDDGAAYTITVRVTSGAELRASHEWTSERYDNRGVVAVVQANAVTFDEYQH